MTKSSTHWVLFPTKNKKNNQNLRSPELQLLVGKGDISLHRLQTPGIHQHWQMHRTTSSGNRPAGWPRLGITSLHLVQSIFSATCPHDLIHCQSLAETHKFRKKEMLAIFCVGREKERCFFAGVF